MKKIIIIAAALFIGTGILASSNKEVAVKPTAAALAKSTISYKKDIGTAD